MSPRSNPKAHHCRHFSFYILHRYLGLLAALFVVLLAITGIMLNHTETLRLNERAIYSDKILEWYGINTDIPEKGYRVGEHWISHKIQSVFFDADSLEGSLTVLTGAVNKNDLIIISGAEKVMLLTQTGELVDVFDQANGLPDGKILRLGFSEMQQVILETEKGIFAAGSDFIAWQDTEADNIKWSQQLALPEVLKASMKKNWRGEGITLERLTLDLHSGRLFGRKAGVLLMDLAAIIMILLVLSGVWMWFVRWRKRAVHIKAFRTHHSDQ